METKLTKGEWYLDSSSNPWKLINQNDECLNVLFAFTDEQQHNAQLMLHAPKLLSMVEELKEGLQYLSLAQNHYPKFDSLIIRAEQLIKDATILP